MFATKFVIECRALTLPAVNMRNQHLAILFFAVVLIAGGDFLLGSANAIDPSECRNVMCPQRDIVCPADSVVLFIPTTPPFEPIDLNRMADGGSVADLGREPQANPLDAAALDISNHTISRRSPDRMTAAVQSKEDKGKRSVPETDDELIDVQHVIVPIGSLDNKTNVAVPYVENSGEELMKICCTQSMCICKPELCPSPKCEPGLVPIVMNRDVGQPGHCCPIFKCDSVPDCQNLDNGHNWRENCRSCLCFEKEAKCQETSCLAKQHEEDATEDKGRQGGNDCYSIALSRPFVNGATWKEGDCDHCECKDGEVKCRTNFCINLVCEDQVKIPGECCPKCKDFCEKHEYCDKKCSFGHTVDKASGCQLCECAPLPPLVPRDSNQTITSSPALTNGDSSPVTGPSITGTQSTATTTTTTTTGSAEAKPSVQINIVNNNYHNSTTTTVAEQDENWNGHIYVGTIAFIIGIAFGALACFVWMRNRQRKQRSYSTVPCYDSNANPITYKGA